MCVCQYARIWDIYVHVSVCVCMYVLIPPIYCNAKKKEQKYSFLNAWQTVPVAARSKAWVCGRSLAGIVGSNPAGGMNVYFECCLLSGRGFCVGLVTRPEESYRVWCVKWSAILNVEALDHWGLLHHGKKDTWETKTTDKVRYLTNFEKQSPSWGANWFSSSQEMPRILWTPKVYLCIHKCPTNYTLYRYEYMNYVFKHSKMCQSTGHLPGHNFI